MEMPSNFVFDDFDFEFLAPPPPKQDATNSSSSIEVTSSGQPQKKICGISSSTKNKRSRLAERICNTDLAVRQQADLQQSVNEIKNLYESEKQQRIGIQLKSANWHKENEMLRNELEEWKLKCEQLEARVKENIPPVDIKKLVSGYVRVAQKLYDQCSYNAMHKQDLINLLNLKEFCIDNKISIFKRTFGVSKVKRTLNVSKVDKAVECLLWTTNPKLVNKPDTCTRATQCVRARTKEQGTQYKTFTLSCGTMTTSEPPVGRIDVATNFPEPKQLPALHEILSNTIKAWDIKPISPINDPPKEIQPISPITDLPESPTKETHPISPNIDPPESPTKETNPISPKIDPPDSPIREMSPIGSNNSPESDKKDIEPISPINDPPEAFAININPISPINTPPKPRTQELVKEMKTVGTCTILCNVLTNIDDVLQLPKIKRCDSRPPSRSMFSSVKDEMSTLNLPYGGLKDYFNEKLLSSKSFGEAASSISNFTPDMFEELWQLFGQMVLGLLQRRSTHPNTKKEEFNSWLPQMYEACQNFEHEILLQTLPIGVPCSSSSPPSNDQKEYVNQHKDFLPKTKSIGTSPIKPSEFENSFIVGEKDNYSNNKKTSDNILVRRIRHFSERSMFRPIDSQEPNPKMIKLSNASNANTSIDDPSDETAVNFLSSLSTFKNVCDNSLVDLDESEMKLLASANYPMFNCPPHSQIYLESNSLESNEVTGSIATGGEVEMALDKSPESINVNTETNTSIVDKISESINVNTETNTSKVDKSLESINVNTESDTSITKICSKKAKDEKILNQLLTDRSPENFIGYESNEEDAIHDNLIIDDTITSDISNDKVNMNCSVKSGKLVQQENAVKNNFASHLCSSSYLSRINELFGDVPKSPERRTRKRKQKADASLNSLNPCKRSARLAEKRLLEENKNIVDAPMIIGKYTTSKYKHEPATNIHDSVKNTNCDKPKSLSISTMTCPTVSDRTYAANVSDFVGQTIVTFPFTNNLQPKFIPTTSTTIRALSTTSSITGYAEKANHCNYNLSDTQLNDNSKHHKEQSLCVASVDDFESPSSPKPWQDYDEEQFKNDSLPIEIPLNLRKPFGRVGSNSLLETIMNKERQKMTKVNKKVEIHEEKLIREMCTTITEYLQSSQQYDVRNLCYDLQKFSQKVDLYISALLDCGTLKLSVNSQEQSINIRFMNVLQHLQEMYPEILTQFTSKLDAKLFTLNQSMKPTMPESLSLLKIYLATITVQEAKLASPTFKNPARVIVAKILYFFQKDMPRLVYEVLCQFPTVLPHRDERTYDHSDPLITVIKHELMNYQYDMYDEESCSRHLLSKLRYEYHFEIYKPLQQDVLKQLMSKLESGQLKHLQLSFAVFCKRMFMPKCLKDVINGSMLPLVNTYYDLAKLSSDYDERIAALFTCMSTVLKSFVLETDISACMSVFKRFLHVIKRPCVQEAAVQAIIRLQRYGYNMSSEALKDFQPNYTLQPLTVAMLKSFAQRKIQYNRSR